MRYIIIALMGAIALAAFNWPKCEHVYVSIEESIIKVERPQLGYSIEYPERSDLWPSGILEGKDIVCIKCLQKTKQRLDYGQPNSQKKE